ncbi:MAG: TolC family protein [Chitinophagales bacterium]
MKIFLKYLIGLLVFVLSYQNHFAQSDSVIYTYDEFIYNIENYHPIAKQAALKIDFGRAKLLEAKGNFDPELNSDWSEKQFDDKLYYRKYGTNLSIPTPIGLKFDFGYSNTTGEFVNPENNTDPFGLWNIGIELDILQGLIINERSAALKQARIFQDLAVNEQKIILNELIYNASYAYLQWKLYHNFKSVLQENLELAQEYYSSTKASFFGGEKTAIDTLEAYIIFQDASISLNKNNIELIKSKLYMENFLWYQDTAIALNELAQPEPYNERFGPLSINWLDTAAIANNPIILASMNKLSMLEIEQRLKRDKLKPKLKLKYNPLLNTTDNVAPNFSADNFAWGFAFSMPLFLRSERAAVQQTNIKIQDLQLNIDNKLNELENKVENSWQQQFQLQQQLLLSTQNVDNYRRLLEGENTKFLFGESSVFLLNKRQEKYIAARLKLAELQIKQEIERLNYLYYTNQLLTN